MYSTVQCYTQTLCPGFLFVLEFGTFNLLLQYICRFVFLTVQCCIQTVCCGFQFVSADSRVQYIKMQYTALYSDCMLWLSVWFSWKYIKINCYIHTLCCGFQFALQFGTFNLLLQYVCNFFSWHYSRVRYSIVQYSAVLYTNCVFLFSVCITVWNI